MQLKMTASHITNEMGVSGVAAGDDYTAEMCRWGVIVGKGGGLVG